MTAEQHLVLTCERLFDAGDLHSLLGRARYGTKAWPENLRFWQLLGLAYLARGDVSSARYVYNDALRHCPKDFTLLLFYSANCLCSGFAHIALDIIRRNYFEMSAANQRGLMEILNECVMLGIVDSEELPQLLEITLGCTDVPDLSLAFGTA